MQIVELNYIIKLVLIAATAFFVGSYLHFLRHNHAIKYLTIFLSIFTVNNCLNLPPLYNFVVIKKILFITGSSSVIIFLPLLYLYVKNIESPKPFKSLDNFIHLIPAIIYLMCLLPALKIDVTNPAVMENELERIYNGEYKYFRIVIFIFFYIFLNIQIFLYLTLIYISKKRYHRKIKEEFSEIGNKMLKWIDALIVMIVLLSAIFFFTFYLLDLPNDIVNLKNDILFICIILFIGIHGLRQQEPYSSYKSKNVDLLTSNENESYKTEKLNQEQKKILISSLNELMENEKLYLNPDVQLSEIAKKMNTSKNKISQVLNEDLGLNFYNYINSKRIETACNMLINKEFDVITIEGISEKAGFKSKTSFNQNFKTIIGKTPSEYRKQIFESMS